MLLVELDLDLQRAAVMSGAKTLLALGGALQPGTTVIAGDRPAPPRPVGRADLARELGCATSVA